MSAALTPGPRVPEEVSKEMLAAAVEADAQQMMRSPLGDRDEWYAAIFTAMLRAGRASQPPCAYCGKSPGDAPQVGASA